MAKTKAPLFSLNATGTLGNTITYKKNLQNNIAQKYSQPGAKNPFESSPRQKDQRSIIRLITIHWQCMSSVDKLSWENAAKDVRFKGTGYHYFLHMAQQNLTQYLGLVGYWSMNYNVDDKIPDLSGNGNHGILSPIFPCDCPTLVDSFDIKQGKAALFNGTTNYINCGSDVSLDITTELTLECLINFSTSQVSRIFACRHSGAHSYAFGLSDTLHNKIKFYTAGTGGPNVLHSPLTYNDGHFHHVVCTFDGSIKILYMDGLEVNSIPYAGDLGVTGPFDFNIGRLTTVGQFFNGIIDDLLIFNKVLSPETIFKHYSFYNL